MCLSLPEVLISIVGNEKLVPTWADLDVFLRLLPRSSAGERMNPYTSMWRVAVAQQVGDVGVGGAVQLDPLSDRSSRPRSSRTGAPTRLSSRCRTASGGD